MFIVGVGIDKASELNHLHEFWVSAQTGVFALTIELKEFTVVISLNPEALFLLTVTRRVQLKNDLRSVG